MNDNAKIQNEEEISLLDLFAVLLRYRKIIIGIMLTLIVLVVIGYFIYPVRQYKYAVKNRMVQGRILISIKQSMLNFTSKNPENFINRADVVMDSLREAGMKEFKYSGNKTISLTNEADRKRALYIINQILIMNKSPNGKDYNESKRIFQVITNTTRDVKTVVRDNYTVEVLFKDKDPELIISFFKRLVVHGNEIAGDSIRSLAEVIVNNYEQIMDGAHAGRSWEDVMGGYFLYYAYVKDFLDGKESVLTAVGEPVIIEPDIFLDYFQKSYIPMGVILVFAGIFLAVFLAFVLNTIRSIRNDEQAMKKIYDAMGKTDSQ